MQSSVWFQVNWGSKQVKVINKFLGTDKALVINKSIITGKNSIWIWITKLKVLLHELIYINQQKK